MDLDDRFASRVVEVEENTRTVPPCAARTSFTRRAGEFACVWTSICGDGSENARYRGSSHEPELACWLEEDGSATVDTCDFGDTLLLELTSFCFHGS